MIDICWDEKFEIGHSRIDHEHQVFVDLIRTVSQEARGDCPKERISRLLMEVKKYAEFHFISEENIMIDAAYPEYEPHKREHDMLLAQLDNEFYRYRSGETELDSVAGFMFRWFALHTTQEDLKIAQYLRKP